MGWPECVATIAFMLMMAVFFSGWPEWPKVIVHKKCNCKKDT